MDLGGRVNSFAGWLCAAPAVHAVVGNPLYTALLITALAAVVALAVCGGEKPGAKKKARAFVYVLIVVTGITFVHHYAVVQAAGRSSTTEGVRSVFSSIEAVRALGGGGDEPVVPGRRPPEAPPGPAPAPPGPRPPRPANVASPPFDLEIHDVRIF